MFVTRKRFNQIDQEREDWKRWCKDYEGQVEKLATFILENIPGEPSRSEGAVDTAIRLLGEQVKETP